MPEKNGAMMTRRASARAFIESHTEVTSPPMCPELRLHLAGDMTALWERLEAACNTSRPVPFWALAWVGGQALARYLLDHPASVAQKRVHDFGAGGGVVAIAAAKGGAARVAACDSDAMARAAIRLNAALNEVAIEVIADDVLGRDLDGVDVILAGDVWYERDLASRATPWLRRQAARGRDVLIGDKRRAYFPKGGLEELARYAIATSTEVEQGPVTEAGVWRVLP
jgi:predicted nicotinamide N-methyase